MTREHVPPASTGNDQPVRQIEDPFDRNVVLREVAEWREGHVVRTLDDGCNQRASDWGHVGEYGRWHDLFVAAHVNGRTTRIDPYRGVDQFRIELPYDVMPARFVRQVVGMLLAVQVSERLFAQHPRLAELIDGDPADPSRAREGGLSIEPLRLYMSVYSGKWAYETFPITFGSIPLTSTPLIAPAGSRVSESEIYLLALAPFVFLASDTPQETLGLDISAWTTWDRNRRLARHQLHLEVPTVDTNHPGIRALLYPADYVVG